MEDTIVTRIAIVILAVVFIIVSIVMVLSFISTDNKIGDIEGFVIGQRLSDECEGVQESVGTVMGCKVDTVTLIEAINERKEEDK